MNAATGSYASSISRSSQNFIGVTTSKNLNATRDYTRLQILYNTIISQFNTSIDQYVDGSFTEFLASDVMTEGNLIDVALNINNDDVFKMTQEVALDQDFNYEKNSRLVTKYRDLSNKLVDMLKQAITEYIKIKNLQDQNTELLTFKEILQDREKLLEYISEIQTTSYLFSASATYSQNLQIKPWYEVYLREHGPPGDGVFESDKLAVIVEQLIASGEISEDDYLNS